MKSLYEKSFQEEKKSEKMIIDFRFQVLNLENAFEKKNQTITDLKEIEEEIKKKNQIKFTV